MKYISAAAVLALIFACTPEKNPGTNENNGKNNGSTTEVVATAIKLSSNELNVEKGKESILTVTYTPYDVTNKTVTWVSLNEKIATVKDGIVIGVVAGSTEIVAKCGDVTDKCAVTVVVPASSVSLDLTDLTLVPGETATLTATVLPEDSTDEVMWESSNETVAIIADGLVTATDVGEATITAKVGKQKAECKVTVMAIPDGAVDLGIVMTREDGMTYTLYWANANLGYWGLCNPEDDGNYYAWGETEPKSHYSWLTYTFRTSGQYPYEVKFSKYNNDSSRGTVDYKTVLEPEDDVAHVALGGNWRMPTDVEWAELRTRCTWTWISNYNFTGKSGMIVTATNGNSIFLPAARYKDVEYFDSASCGHYWSSSLKSSDPTHGRYVYFLSDGFWIEGDYRYIGKSVRPVFQH